MGDFFKFHPINPSPQFIDHDNFNFLLPVKSLVERNKLNRMLNLSSARYKNESVNCLIIYISVVNRFIWCTVNNDECARTTNVEDARQVLFIMQSSRIYNICILKIGKNFTNMDTNLINQVSTYYHIKILCVSKYRYCSKNVYLPT